VGTPEEIARGGCNVIRNQHRIAEASDSSPQIKLLQRASY